MKRSTWLLAVPGILGALAACTGAKQGPAVVAPSVAANGNAPSQAPAAPASSEDDAMVPIDADDPTWGDRNAPVTIVEFSDLQCPFCGRAAITLGQLEEQYGKAKLRVVFKNRPLAFHAHAREAAEAAAGARVLGGDDAFWKFTARAFAAQGALGPDAYAKWATEIGIDPGALARGLANHEWADKVERDAKLADQFTIDGTPAFLVNGAFIDGAQPIGIFESVIDGETKKALALLASGTAPDRVYTEAVAANVKAQAEAADQPEKADPHVYKVPVGTSPVLGSNDALVTVIVFSDFQCPFCKHVEPTLKEVRAKYGKDVRIVWKNEPLPFHANARPAAELALEARAEKGDAGFWAAHDALFDASPTLDDAKLEAIARDLKLDAARVKSALETKKHERVIQNDEELADDVGANGTPHFFINGRRLAGAQPVEAFSAVIDAELAKARALVSGGVKPSAVYAAVTKDGLDPGRKTVAPSAHAPSRGDAHGKVVIEEFADFQCPFCQRADPILDALMKAHPGQVRIVWRNLPLEMHPDAEIAAEAAMEAFAQKGDAGFWKMHDLIFANQGVDGSLKRDSLDQYAKQIGLDGAKWTASMDAHTRAADVKSDAKAADDAGIQGTPAFLVNGYFVEGAAEAKLKRLVDRALSEAKQGAK